MLTDVATVGEGFGQLGTETSYKIERYSVSASVLIVGEPENVMEPNEK